MTWFGVLVSVIGILCMFWQKLERIEHGCRFNVWDDNDDKLTREERNERYLKEKYKDRCGEENN